MKSETCFSVAHGIVSHYTRNLHDLNIAFPEKTLAHVNMTLKS